METKIIKIHDLESGRLSIEEAGELIKAGELVAFPTETVYGLGGDALNKESSKKIYAAKGRPSDNPLIVHVADIEHAEKIVASFPEEARKLAKKYWPGPLTMRFKKNDLVPDTTTGGLDTVAIRMPDHEIALAFIKASGGYIAAPSANTSGRPSPTLASYVYEDMQGKIPMILDGGQVGIGIESTIVDFAEDEITILRPGYITKQMIEEVLGVKVLIDPSIDGVKEDAGADAHPKAPGMKYRHYAPKAELTLIEGEDDKVLAKIMEILEGAKATGKRIGLMVIEEHMPTLTQFIDEKNLAKQVSLRCIGSRKKEATIARELYKVLREFDDEGVDVIYSESTSKTGIGMAIYNRLIRAAGHKEIQV